MNNLPVELIVIIFIKLSFPNILTFMCISKEFHEIFMDILPCLTIPKFKISKYENYKFLVKYRPKIRILKVNVDCINEDIVKMDFTMIRYEKLFLNLNRSPFLLYDNEVFDIIPMYAKYLKCIEIFNQNDTGMWKFVVNNNNSYLELLKLCDHFKSFMVRTLVINRVKILNIDFTSIKYTRLYLKSFYIDDDDVSKKINISHSKIWKCKISDKKQYDFLLNLGCEFKTLKMLTSEYEDEGIFDLSPFKYEKIILKNVYDFGSGFEFDIGIIDPKISEKCKGITISWIDYRNDIFINSLSCLRSCEHIKLAFLIGDFDSVIKFTKTLPKLRKLTLVDMRLQIKDLELLSCYQHIILKKITLPENWNIDTLHNNTQVDLKSCWISVRYYAQFDQVLYGNKL